MLRFYNSYTRRKEAFYPLRGKIVRMYNCGPTVYDYAHIGNLRSFLFADVLRRYLEYRAYKVKQVMNITDVGHMTTDAEEGEDKMILAMRREGKNAHEIARLYEKAFFEDIKALGVKSAWKYPRATEHISEMIALVKKLLKRGHAYLVREKSGGNSVYYDLSTFPRYGKLSGNRVEDLIPGARAEVVHEKKQPYDFALWIYKPGHILQWNTPWGKGYPGWHLECSAMAMKYLGQTLDIHTGGEDNKFPHHECEIAQSEGATGKQFARLWLHVKHLLVDGRKMSKSLKNFYTLRDLRRRGFSPRVIRYALVSSHYRETLNFTLDGLQAAESALERVDELMEKLKAQVSSRAKSVADGRSLEISRLVAQARRDFIAAMDDDLNVPKALAALYEFVRKLNGIMSTESPHQSKLGAGQAGIMEREQKEALKVLKEFDSVLGLGIGAQRKTAIPSKVMKLVNARQSARAAKDWREADALRVKMRSSGYIVEDTPDGPRIKAISSS